MNTNARPNISGVFRYQDGPAAIEWLVQALGFEKLSDHRMPNGLVAHADLRFGSSVIGVSSAAASAPDSPWAAVRQGLYVCMNDPDGFHDRARAAGAEIVCPLSDQDYGSRDFSLRDPGGHLWGFGTYDMGANGGEPAAWAELRYPDAALAVDWLERAIGFQRAAEIPDEAGRMAHAELRLGSSVLMLGPEMPNSEWPDARQVVHLRVDDPDAHFARVSKCRPVVVRQPQTAPYGARFYAVRDPEGFLWWVSNYRPANIAR
jgi:uncharacterized glyoxalase superfamily protein PhnB